MTYRFPTLAKTPLLAIVIWLALPAGLPRAALADGPNVHFVTDGTILPRRGHEVLTIESTDIERLDATILHVSEGDTLRVLGRNDGTIPPEASEIWHSQLPVKGADKPGQKIRTTLDVLQLVKSLQPGLYIADVHEVNSGTPRAVARKMFVISNIGLEAFVGADSLAVQARLLSEASPAVNIDIALIARNNREIARLRSDNDGIVRFGKDQITGSGQDAPAALYAYGADGEFTVLPFTIALPSPPPAAIASIVTDKQTYKPGEDIRGLVLTRITDGSGVDGLIIQLENSEGGVADFADKVRNNFTLHAPPAPFDGKWTLRAYRILQGKPVAIGQSAIAVSTESAPPTTTATKQAVANTGDIVISPGRRSFQRGQMADISVQPPQDALVTIALVDHSVRAIVRQKIGKEGAPIQLPVPADADSGMYVIATAFMPPVSSNGVDNGQPLHRSYGAQWIEIDEGAKRMSVRLDTPEKTEIGGKLPISVTLPDLAGKSGQVQIIGTDASQPVSLDPFAFFYGRKPMQVQVLDTYATVIGAVEASVPDFAAPEAAAQPSAPALLWPMPYGNPKLGSVLTTSANGKTSIDETFPTMSGASPQLRISAVAWSADKLGYGEATVTGTRATKNNAKPAKTLSSTEAAVHIKPTTIKPDTALMLKPHEAVVTNIDPVVALPLGYEEAGGAEAGGEPDGDNVVFIDSETPAVRSLLLSQLEQQDDDAVLANALVAVLLPPHNVYLPDRTEAKLVDAVQAIASNPDVSADRAMLAHYILLRAQREQILTFKGWLQGNPQFQGMLAKAARLSLAQQAPISPEESAKLNAEIDGQQGSDLETRALTLALLGQQPWPSRIAKATSDEALKLQQSLPFRVDLALRVAQQLHAGFGKPKIESAGKPIEPEIQNSGPGSLKIVNKDTRPVYAWVVSNLPK